MMYKRISLIGIVLLGMVIRTSAQDSGLSLLTFGAFVQPTGDFQKSIGHDPHLTRRSGFDIGDKVGLAAIGLGMGAELDMPLKTNGIYWVLSLQVLTQGGKDRDLEAAFSKQLGDQGPVDFQIGRWYNIPLLSGIRGRLVLNRTWSVSGSFQAGINLTRAASRTAVVQGIVVEKTSYDFTRDFGFLYDLGVDFRRRFHIGLQYMNMRTPRFEGEKVLSEKLFPEIYSRQNAILGEDRSVAMFTVRLGYYLF